MTPIDDELRALLHSRADVLTPAPDPLGGIERRARRMRRNRVAASVAGSALVVAAIGIAVPALLPEGGGTGQVATSTEPTPSASPSVAASAAPGALDPQHPWDYRGDAGLINDNELASLQAEWSAKHPGATVKPLYGSVYESSQQPEIVFVSTGGGADRWGIGTTSHAGWTWLHDEPLSPGTTALLAALSGDEAPRLLVVASPATGDIGYALDGTTFRSIQRSPGIGLTPLEGDTTKDVVRVLDGDGNEDEPVFRGPAPDYLRPSSPPSTPSSVKAPAETSSAPALAARYAFDPAKPWKYRGPTELGDVVAADNRAFTASHGQGPWTETPLYAAHLSATTEVAVVLHVHGTESYVTFTAQDGNGTHQEVDAQPKGQDILSAYVALDAAHGLLIGAASDQAANLVLQTGDRAEVGGSKTAGIWDWAPKADPQARLAVFAAGDAEPYSSQSAT